ncbi:xenotropic and polytropic retrovirus receptor 1 homolog [Scaptodrosophila lebanonensis]|uniref:Xenotropic and polytropic retrovirus receptor 1 homolog n=1 Tax=Drosophila lebanonensis TaxID=7225 RepID=A0A6J2UFP8_DROLE|nr:xenotropic and polytropic retrovirus receptor 1 homolog [Scaptodrosophila lebanonensis]
MKFGKTFESHLTMEWRQQYMDYVKLKTMIRQGVENAPNPKSTKQYDIDAYFRAFESNFFIVLKEELVKVNNFYAEKLAEARRKHAQLKINLFATVRVPGQLADTRSSLISASVDVKNKRNKTRKLRFAYSEFYLSLILLQNYQNLNLTGFRKICKKYNKYLKSSAGTLWFEQNVVGAPFTDDRLLQQLINEVEELYIKHLADGNRAKAMAKLRVPPLGQPTPPGVVFCAGLVLGLFIVGALTCIASYFYFRDSIQSLMYLYRGQFVWILFCFYLTINVKAFQNVGVNHVLIFEIEPRHHLQPPTFLRISSTLGYICTLSILAFIYYKDFELQDPYIFPLVPVVISLVFLFNPIRIMNYPARRWLIRVFGRVVAAPFYYVRFVDFWVADQMNSLVLCIVDYYYLMRFYWRYWNHYEDIFYFEPDYVVPLLRGFPAWLRLVQCLRRYHDSSSKSISYLLNALKYTTTLMVVLFSTLQMESSAKYSSIFENPYTWLYLASALVSTIFCTGWDLLRDFGLFKIWRWDNFLLREKLVYPKCFYYFVMFENVTIRCFWAIEFYLVYNNFVLPYNCKTLASFLEVTRRFFWNFLRLENEHLYNCGRFRATRDIFIAPLNPRQEQLLERMMDESTLQASKGNESLSEGEDNVLDKKYF